MKLYTKQGDDGKSKIRDEIKFKDDIFFECTGTIDELNSILGIAKNSVENDRIYKEVTTIQKHLFVIGTEIASIETTEKTKDENIKDLEDLIDYYMKDIELNRFIIPGSSKESAYFHFARTITRRTERVIVSLLKERENVNENIIKYMNRLSDALFAISIFLEDTLESPKY